MCVCVCVFVSVCSVRSSNIRPFRLAATLCASCLVEGLVAARKKRAESLATAQFQYESENKKGKAANQVCHTHTVHLCA